MSYSTFITYIMYVGPVITVDTVIAREPLETLLSYFSDLTGAYVTLDRLKQILSVDGASIIFDNDSGGMGKAIIACDSSVEPNDGGTYIFLASDNDKPVLTNTILHLHLNYRCISQMIVANTSLVGVAIEPEIVKLQATGSNPLRAGDILASLRSSANFMLTFEVIDPQTGVSRGRLSFKNVYKLSGDPKIYGTIVNQADVNITTNTILRIL